MPGTSEEHDLHERTTVFVRLRAGNRALGRCLQALGAVSREHPDVAVSLAGVSKDARHVLVTVGIDAGPRSQVARFSDAATAAYLFTQDVFRRLFDYLPHYAAEPADEEQEAAAHLALVLAGRHDDAPRRHGALRGIA